MNKKLEEEKFWELVSAYSLSLDNENYDDLRAFAREIHNAALTACREKLEKLDLMGNGIDTHEIAEAIDSLKT